MTRAFLGRWGIVSIILCVSSLAWGQSIMLSSDRRPEVPEEYLVEKGDTLWDICEYYFAEPRKWPTIWALMPKMSKS